MDPLAMQPYGQALLDFFGGDLRAACTVCRDDGLRDEMPVREFFRQRTEFSPLERCAIDRCRGSVLDVGAGAGAHTLVLQDKGFDVVAIDVCPAAVGILIARGVTRAYCADVFDLSTGAFDTILLLMHGIGLVEDLAGLDRFLRFAHSLVKPSGQILADSLDVRATAEPVHTAYQATNHSRGRYGGEVRMRFEYQGLVGPYFGWLHVDPGTLRDHARQAGWRLDVLSQEPDGNYLARLTRDGH